MIRCEWLPDERDDRLPVRQVYAFIFSEDGRVLVLDDDGSHNLPGGTPEGDEHEIETLIREVLEEARVTFRDPRYLGCRRVEMDGELFLQLRYAAAVHDIRSPAADVATGRTYRRLWVPPYEVNPRLAWGESGQSQIDRALVEARRMGVVWTGAPISDIDA